MDAGISRSNNNLSFNAIPLGRYRVAKREFIDIYRVEKSDLGFISGFSDGISDYFKKNGISNESTKDIMRDSFSTAKDILSSSDELLDDARVLVGVRDGNLSGILIGNIAKRDSKGRLHYSSRKNHSKNERELDWFVTWNSHGVGKSLIGEFFRSMREFPFKKLFVRSEVPENSFAQSVYEHFGFKQIGKRRDWIQKNTNINIIDDISLLDNSEVVPMAISRSKVNSVSEVFSKQGNRQDLAGGSVPLSEIIKD